MTDQPTEIATNHAAARSVRAALRREKIAARLAIPHDVHQRASAAIQDRLARLLLPRPVGTIGFCWPIRAEFDCRPLITQLLDAGWQACMPTVVARDTPMEFRGWTTDAPMTTDPFGIPVPGTTTVPAPDVLLLPLVACDAAGYRLGYGGGFFDRTLAACAPRPLAIGVGFDLAAVATTHPGAHDIPLDYVITESNSHRFASY